MEEKDAKEIASKALDVVIKYLDLGFKDLALLEIQCTYRQGKIDGMSEIIDTWKESTK